MGAWVVLFSRLLFKFAASSKSSMLTQHKSILALAKKKTLKKIHHLFILELTRKEESKAIIEECYDNVKYILYDNETASAVGSCNTSIPIIDVNIKETIEHEDEMIWIYTC